MTERFCFIDYKQEFCGGNMCVWTGICNELNDLKKRVDELEQQQKT